MNDEFSDFQQVQSSDPSYCQSWEACAKQYYQSSITHDRHLFEDEGESRGYADDATWILTSSFVIFTMQSGFGMLEAGSCSPGFEVNIMMKNIVDVVFTALTYYLVGYGISFGKPSTSFMGKGSFPADGGYEEVQSGILYSQYIFQLSFAATSTTIVSGCVAMRLKFFVYVLYSLIAVIFYSFVAHWVFDPNGWLRQMGAHDFAGGSSVHVFGGINGLVATLFLGPRTGRFNGTRPISDFFPSSPSSQCLGLLALWWGWIGFNCGSSFGITDDRWVVAIRCAVTTVNSTVGGGVTSIIYSLWRTRGRLVIPDHVINGILGSLVAITPACASTHTFDAFPIGAVGALVALATNTLLCHRRIDDPVGAIGVHAGSGTWGLLSVGLFADSELPGIDIMGGLFRGGGFKLLGLQALTIVCTVGWALMWSTAFFYLVGIALSGDWKDPRKGLRVDLEEEIRGADWVLHGVMDDQAYNAALDSGEEEASSSSDNFSENERRVSLTRKSDMYARSNLRGQAFFANLDKIVNSSHDEDSSSPCDPVGEQRQNSSQNGSNMVARSLFLGNFDDLMENKEKNERASSDNGGGDGKCDDVEDLEIGLGRSSPCESNPGSAAESPVSVRIQERGREVDTTHRPRMNSATSRRGILGMSPVVNHSHARAEMMRRTRRASVGERSLQIYR
ncbi:hypothetical protein ACHAXR_008084 [Thalassiosira sp. AJA248-18]